MEVHRLVAFFKFDEVVDGTLCLSNYLKLIFLYILFYDFYEAINIAASASICHRRRVCASALSDSVRPTVTDTADTTRRRRRHPTDYTVNTERLIGERTQTDNLLHFEPNELNCVNVRK